ncbi:diguanylate cyclase domain-containing protein [Sandaracinus amylolyticus]|uniref:diguanylate cyclase domain-containing protein n=1 Tax=Sandaracinus amylolyticus TaxID=927083 RepID=UPI001F354225|nr:diguanylate cyclase [Sandaracinus amylolyticus]UJR82892.1 Hypothetical protein I5071_49570 [Sandaracinus amylolyticus]
MSGGTHDWTDTHPRGARARLIRQALVVAFTSIGSLLALAALSYVCTRESDVVARLGGDELVVAAMVRDEDAAGAFDGRLRELVRAHNARGARPFRVSLSVGSALWRAQDGKDLEAVVQEADAAMYAQERARRSAVTTSGEAIVRPRPKA